MQEVIMEFNKIIDMLTKSNIDNEGIYSLISEASSMDLSKEENQRELIRKGAKIANRDLTPEIEDKIIDILKEKGISNDLFNYIK